MANVSFYSAKNLGNTSFTSTHDGMIVFDRYDRSIGVVRGSTTNTSSYYNCPVAYSMFNKDVIPCQSIATISMDSSNFNLLEVEDGLTFSVLSPDLVDFTELPGDCTCSFETTIGVVGCNSLGAKYTNLYDFLHNVCLLPDGGQISLKIHEFDFYFPNAQLSFYTADNYQDTDTYADGRLTITKSSSGLTFSLHFNVYPLGYNEPWAVDTSWIVTKNQITGGGYFTYTDGCAQTKAYLDNFMPSSY